MKKIYLTLLLTGLGLVSMAQNEKNTHTVQYVYRESTPESYTELKSLVKGDKKLKEIAFLKYENATLKGKIILSSKQFAPIKEKIDKAPENPIGKTEVEMVRYAEKVSKRYVCVTDLIK